MPTTNLYCGIDLGGTNIQIGIVDPAGKVLGSARKKTTPEQGIEKVLDRLAEGVEEAAAKADTDIASLAGLGIGAPGPIDPHAGVVLEAVNLRWDNVPLAKLLRDRLDIPVAVDNDVNVAVFGEWLFGAGKDHADILGVWVGTGIGGGLILNNHLYHGAFFTAGEIGHTTLFPHNPFGSRSLEQHCSRTSVVERIARLIRSNEKSVIPSLVEGNLNKIKSKVVAEAYRQNDPLTRRVVDESAHFLGIQIASTVTLLGLPLIILGGGLTEALGKPYVQLVQESVHAHVFPDRCKRVKVVASLLEDDAGIIGAAELARRRLNKPAK